MKLEFLVCVLLSLSVISICEEEDELLFVVEIVRHGARSEIAVMSFYEDITWPEGPGQLTSSGMREHYLLGKALRKEYVDGGLLSGNFTPEELYIRSTDVNRTIMSAYSQLMGFFPDPISSLPVHDLGAKPPLDLSISDDVIKELGDHTLPYSIGVYPIDVYESKNERLIDWGGSCPIYSKIRHDIVNNGSTYESIKKEYRGVMVKLCSILNIDYDIAMMGGLTNMLLDDLIAADFDGQRPDIIDDDLMLQIREFHYAMFKEEMTGDPRLIKIAMTGLSKYLSDVFNTRISDETSKLRMAIFSTHDSVVAPILAGMDNSPPNAPPFMPYAANIIFELYKSSDTHVVKAKYNGEYFMEADIFQFNKFMSEKAAATWDDWNMTCNGTDNSTFEDLRQMNKMFSSAGNGKQTTTDNTDQTQLAFWGLLLLFATFCLVKVLVKKIRKCREKSLPSSTLDNENVECGGAQPFLA